MLQSLSTNLHLLNITQYNITHNQAARIARPPPPPPPTQTHTRGPGTHACSYFPGKGVYFWGGALVSGRFPKKAKKKKKKKKIIG